MANKPAVAAFLALLSCLPLALFACLGQFSRLVADDFTHFVIGLEYGPWRALLHWREIHNGSYSDYLLHGLVAPLDTLLPPLFPAFMLALWLPGCAWLIAGALAGSPLGSHKPFIPLSLSALSLAAAINAFYAPHAYYWFSGSARYTLPLALLTVFLAAAVHAGRSSPSLRILVFGGLAAALYCFAVAGFSEMFCLFQLTLLALLFPLSLLLRVGSRRGGSALLAAGLAGTCASLLAQLSAPGASLRLEGNAAEGIWLPIRHLPLLISRALEETFLHLGHQEAFAGFMLLGAASMFLALRQGASSRHAPPASAFKLDGKAVFAGLAIQLCFAPLLWSHVSDNALILNRFSPSFFFLIVVHAAVVGFFIALLLWRRRLSRILSASDRGLLIFVSLALGLLVLLFALTQLRAIHYAASTYLFAASLIIAHMLAWHLRPADADAGLKRQGFCALMWLPLTAMVLLAIALAALYAQGRIQPRVLSGVAFMQVFGGLLWGSWLGRLIVWRSASVVAEAWTRWLRRACLCLALAIGIAIFAGQTRSIAELAEFAAEWDARHALMLRQIEAGKRELDVPALTVDISRLLCCELHSSQWNAKQYYNYRASRFTGGDG